MVITPVLSPFNGSGAVPRVRVKHPFIPYRLEIVNSVTNQTICPLPKMIDGSWEQSTNEPAILSFTYPALEPESEYLAFPNRVALIDGYGEILDHFTIQDVTVSDGESGKLLNVSAGSLLSLLNNHVLIDYQVNEWEEKTIKEIIREWLEDYQPGNQRIQYGYIDPAIGDQLRCPSVQGGKILGGINDLHESAEGYFWVSRGGRFFWQLESNYGERKGQEIRYKKNLVGLTRQINTQGIITRGYFYGAGDTKETRLTLKDANHAHEYWEQNVGLYGIVSDSFVNKEITNPATLKRWAIAKMKEVSKPEISYSISMIDLSESDSGLDFSFEYLKLGSEVRVIDEQLGVNVATRVLKISRSLSNPLDVRVELSTKKKQIADLISDLNKRQRILENADVGPSPSNETPQPNGTGNPGISDDYARADHEHPSGGGASNTMPSYVQRQSEVGTEEAYARGDHKHGLRISDFADDIRALIPPVDLSSAIPLAVDTVGKSGTSLKASRDDHIHPPYKYGARVFTFQRYADIAAPNGITFKEGDICCITGLVGSSNPVKNNYIYRDGKWRVIGRFETPNAPYHIGELPGDHWYQAGTKTEFVHSGDFWIPTNKITSKIGIQEEN